MNMMLPAKFLMDDAEADREMERCFRERAEQEAAERAARQSDDACRDVGTAAPDSEQADGDPSMEVPPDLSAALDALINGEPVPESAEVSHPVAAEGSRAVVTDPVMPSKSGDSSGSEPRGVADLSVFPVTSAAELRPSADPLREMTDLCRQILDHKDYARVRTKYCRLSIQLNELGRLAPAFRPALKTGAPRGDRIHMVLHRDQIVIDLHWCYAKKMAISAPDAAHQVLFDHSESFPFGLAWELSGKKWRSEYRAAEALVITTLQQCQLLKLRGPEVAARAEAVGAGWRMSAGKSASKIAMVRRQIGQWAERDRRIVAQRGYYEQLWLARELLGPDWTNALVAELHAVMVGGDVQDRTTIRDKLKSLDRQLKAM